MLDSIVDTLLNVFWLKHSTSVKDLVNQVFYEGMILLTHELKSKMVNISSETNVQ